MRIRPGGVPPDLPGVHRRARARALPARLVRNPVTAVGIVATISVLLVVTAIAGHSATQNGLFEIQSLDGKGNNLAHPEWGSAGSMFQRIGKPNYADGIGAEVDGPNPRFVSNRIFNDLNQNLFNKHNLSRWAAFWGQFVALDTGLKDATSTEKQDITFNATDPLETFPDTMGVIPFTRSAIAPGTGVTTPRQQTDLQTSYLDMSQLYGTTAERLTFLRSTTNPALFVLPGGQLPRKDVKGDPAKAPMVQVQGRLMAAPNKAAVAGDPRANQTIVEQAIFTLFAREHNRIASSLPNSLTAEEKFQIARRVVIAEEQWITFNQWLPTLGVKLPAYRGYNPNVNATVLNEFDTIGFRMHSMIHGQLDLKVDASRYSAAQQAAFKQMGIEVKKDASKDPTGANRLAMQVPLTLVEFNPDLLTQLQIGPVLEGLGVERQYENDEQIDNQLRSVLFQIPVPGNVNCLDGADLPTCFKGVLDLGAVDIQRARDHGLPTYNQLRRDLGLAPKTSFTAITGEATEAFPANAGLKQGDEVNDPRSLDFVKILDANGKPLQFLSDQAQENAQTGIRRTTTAARLKAIYGSVNNVDAFVGMVAEQHVHGTEFGELQMAMWRKAFTAARDGDRFFYGNDPGLTKIQQKFGITFKHSLADIVAANTDIRRTDLNTNNIFLVKDDNADGDNNNDANAASKSPSSAAKNGDDAASPSNDATASASTNHDNSPSSVGTPSSGLGSNGPVALAMVATVTGSAPRSSRRRRKR